jgi:hypothetical protein
VLNDATYSSFSCSNFFLPNRIFRSENKETDRVRRDVGEICSSLICPRTFDEIVAYMVEREDDELVNLFNP